LLEGDCNCDSSVDFAEYLVSLKNNDAQDRRNIWYAILGRSIKAADQSTNLYRKQAQRHSLFSIYWRSSSKGGECFYFGRSNDAASPRCFTTSEDDAPPWRGASRPPWHWGLVSVDIPRRVMRKRIFLASFAKTMYSNCNGDGSVVAANYVMWRKFDGAQSDYNAW
jgi:hypothetical protein